MSDREEADATPSQAAPGPGDMLRMSRQARAMTIAEVAAALKMSPRQIEAIENEDFSRLPGATFIRGFVRNYARLLRIDADPLLAALAGRMEAPQPVLSAPADEGVKMPMTGNRQGKGLVAATAVALTILVVALALYFDVIDVGGSPMGRGVQQTQTASVQDKPERMQQPEPLPMPAARAVSSLAGGSEAPGAPEQSPAQPDGMQILVFSFDGSSWVEVKDGAGRTIFSQMNAKGTTRRVEGRPPFHLVVGNASQVRLQYKEQPVDLRPHTRVEVARLTLD